MQVRVRIPFNVYDTFTIIIIIIVISDMLNVAYIA